MPRLATLLVALSLATTGLAGCLADDPGPDGDEADPDDRLNGSADADASRDQGPSNGTDGRERDPHDGGDANRSQPRSNGTNASQGDENRTDPWAGDPRVTGRKPLEVAPSLRTTQIEVLLVPPTHGDLGEPRNDSRRALDYLNATIDGIHDWEKAIHRFLERYPRYSYLSEIDLQIHVFDGEPPEVPGYDVVVAYLETAGPLFRGAATQGDPVVQEVLARLGLLDTVHASTRYILLSLFASAPRAGQRVPDYPETGEVHDVTMHEFGHTFGLGHTATWTARWGPDLMLSPYPFVYGDGNPLGDGGERSPGDCISTLDLYGLAHVYRWLGNASYEGDFGNVTLPDAIPYEEWCFPGTTGVGLPVAELRSAIEATRKLQSQRPTPIWKSFCTSTGFGVQGLLGALRPEEPGLRPEREQAHAAAGSRIGHHEGKTQADPTCRHRAGGRRDPGRRLPSGSGIGHPRRRLLRPTDHLPP